MINSMAVARSEGEQENDPSEVFGIPRDPDLDRELTEELDKIRDAERRAERETAAIRLR